MGFVNPVVGSYEEDDNISEPSRSFLDGLILLWISTVDKDVFKLAFRSLAFPETPEMF